MAAVVIVILVAVVGFAVWHFTGGRASGPAPIPAWAKAALTNSGGTGPGAPHGGRPVGQPGGGQ